MARLRSSPHANGLNSSPRESPRMYRQSPTRQLELDLERAFSNVRLHGEESQRLHMFNRKQLQDDLDARETAQAIVHKQIIDEALAKHEQVRAQAIAVLEAHVREEEARRKREEEARLAAKAEEERKLAQLRQQRIEKEREARKAKDAAAEVQRIADERAREDREAMERQQREDAQRRAEADRAQAEANVKAADKKRQDDAKAAAEQDAANKAAAAQAATSQPWSPDVQIRHKQYTDVHDKLKQFRKDFWVAAKKDNNLKPVIGDMRRAIRTALGQITLNDKRANKLATDKIRDTLLSAKNKFPGPAVPLSQYLPAHLSLLDKNTTTIPGLLLWLIISFSKSLFESFTTQCSVNPAMADTIGTMVAQIFSLPELQYTRNVPSANSGLHYDKFGGNIPTPPMQPTTVSMIFVVIAKFHKVAPILFGITGSEDTRQGRMRLGWRKKEGAFIPAKAHYERMTGLAAGYSAISLRNFSKAPSKINPYPPTNFWESMSHIINTPGNEVQISHILLMKTMIECGYDRFILFYGNDAMAVLRQATVRWPRTFPAEMAAKTEAKSLVYIAEKWRNEKKIHLT